MSNTTQRPSRRVALLGDRPGSYAIARHVRMSAQKVRRVADTVRGMDATQAIATLRFAPQAAAEPVRKVIESAVANAETSEGLHNEQLVISQIYVDEGVTMRFGSKVPGGTSMEVRDVSMDFGYGRSFTESSPEAYERLILDVLLGDPPLFPTTREVELSWQILDPIEEFWSTLGQPQRIVRSGALRKPLKCSPVMDIVGGCRDHYHEEHRNP